jgi:predicted oxidoreductase
MDKTIQSDVVVVGAGLAGIVTALECLRKGKSVTLIDRDTPARMGGLALWAFGGMALVDTPLQRRMKINDSPDIALRDWLRFGELDANDIHAQQWAHYYVEQCREQVYDWLLQSGVSFLPAVNWVERGLHGDGNSLPRYHVIWGTAQRLTLRLKELMMQAAPSRLTVLHQHEVRDLVSVQGVLAGVHAFDTAGGRSVTCHAGAVVLAMGGVNGGHDEVRANWPDERPMPKAMLNGAHPFADGKIHHQVQAMGGRLVRTGEMWNYAAGIPHPHPHFSGHGLSLIPCKSALWLDHLGQRIGPAPLVTGFDTHDLCQRVAALEKPYSWHLLNWRIAAKELAISGAEHNIRIRDRQFLLFLKETLLGNHRLVRQMARESPHFLVDETLVGLAAKMNALAGTHDVSANTLLQTVNDFDANFSNKRQLVNDDQIRRIEHARHWGPDRLRTCKPAPLQAAGAGPFIAIQTQLITRKSLGGLQTDLQSRVLDLGGRAMPGLFCVGEAAGFGGGGASGKRSLEGTFLPGCILTAKAAARTIATST